MADDVLASFLVALGFRVDSASQKAATKSVADYQRAVEQAEKAIEDARWAGAKTEEEVAALSRATNLRLAREALQRAKDTEKAEQEQARKRKESNAALISGLQRAAIAAAAAATAISYAVAKVAGSFDNLYFQAQRSGTSVQSLNALGYGFSQVGGSAQQASAAVDSFTTKLRNNPGLRQFVKDLGVNESLQGVDKFIATMDALKKQPYEVGVQFAETLGVSEETFNLYVRQSEALKQYRAEYDATAKRFGLNSEQAAAASTAFQRSLTRLQATAGVLADKLMASLAPAIQGLIDRFQRWVDSNPGALDKVLTDIAKAVVYVAESIGRFLAEVAGDSGDAFLKKWDAFVERAQRFAKTIERIVYGIERLVKLLGLVSASTGTGTVLGDGNRTIAALNAISGGTAAPGGPGGADVSAAVPDNRRWYEKVLPNGMGGKPAPGRAQIGGWWTPERQQHAIDTLTKGGVSELGAKALVARWSAVEAADGPASRNPKSGAWGIGQWLTKDRREPIDGNPDFDAQLQHALKELHGPEGKALAALNSAKTAGEAARGASMYERAEGYDGLTGLDNFTAKTEAAMGLLGKQVAQQIGGNIPPVNGVGGLDQNQGGAKHRKEAISDVLQRQIVAAATAAGVNAEVFSGGQDPNHQYGSTRHNHGNAADLKLYTIGPGGAKRYLDMRNDADRAVMEKFIRGSVAAGANGVGAAPNYMGPHGIHVGGGSPAAWGAEGSSANAPDWVSRAHRQGMEDRASGAAAESMRAAGRAVKAAADALPSMRPSGPNMTPGGFDPNRIDPHDVMKPAAPLGASPISNDNSSSRSVTQHITNNTTISEARSPREAARVMESSLSRVHNLSLANAQSAVA